MKMYGFINLVLLFGTSAAFQPLQSRDRMQLDLASSIDENCSTYDDSKQSNRLGNSRRDMLSSVGAVLFGSLLPMAEPANAAVGTLPEFEDTNAIIQGITVNVADKSQQDAMIDFLVRGFDFEVSRKRIKDSIEDTVRLLVFDEIVIFG